jgi:hypothetical protein
MHPQALRDWMDPALWPRLNTLARGMAWAILLHGIRQIDDGRSRQMTVPVSDEKGDTGPAAGRPGSEAGAPTSRPEVSDRPAAGGLPDQPEQSLLRSAYLRHLAEAPTGGAGGGEPATTDAAVRGAYLTHLSESGGGAVSGSERGGELVRSAYAARVTSEEPSLGASPASSRRRTTTAVRKAKGRPQRAASPPKAKRKGSGAGTAKRKTAAKMKGKAPMVRAARPKSKQSGRAKAPAASRSESGRGRSAPGTTAKRKSQADPRRKSPKGRAR